VTTARRVRLTARLKADGLAQEALYRAIREEPPSRERLVHELVTMLAEVLVR
jgi:hypothetical protein